MRKETDTRAAARDYTRREAAKARTIQRRRSRCTKRTAAHLFAFA